MFIFIFKVAILTFACSKIGFWFPRSLIVQRILPAWFTLPFDITSSHKSFPVPDTTTTRSWTRTPLCPIWSASQWKIFKRLPNSFSWGIWLPLLPFVRINWTIFRSYSICFPAFLFNIISNEPILKSSWYKLWKWACCKSYLRISWEKLWLRVHMFVCVATFNFNVHYFINTSPMFKRRCSTVKVFITAGW